MKSNQNEAVLPSEAFVKRAQTWIIAILFAFLGLLLAATTVFAVMGRTSDHFHFGWTPMASTATAGVVVLLMLALSWTLTAAPRETPTAWLIPISVIGGCWIWGLSLASLGFLVFGIAALGVGNGRGARKKGVPQWTVKMLCMFGVMVAAGLLIGLWLLREEPPVFVDTPASTGEWTVVGTGPRYVPDGLAPIYKVVVQRDLWGLVRQTRVVLNRGGRPDVSWQDDRTLLIDGRPFDIWKDPVVGTW